VDFGGMCYVYVSILSLVYYFMLSILPYRSIIVVSWVFVVVLYYFCELIIILKSRRGCCFVSFSRVEEEVLIFTGNSITKMNADSSNIRNIDVVFFFFFMHKPARHKPASNIIYTIIHCSYILMC